MAERLRVQASWEKYRRDIVPATAPEVQIIETQRAFYAGAMALLTVIMDGLEPGGTESTEAEVRMMDEIEAELRAFGARGGR